MRIYKNLATFVWLSLKPVVVLAAAGATVASADVGDVVHAIDSSGASLWNILFGLVLTLGGYIWKREHAETVEHRKKQKEEDTEYKRSMERKLDSMERDIKSALRSDYFSEQRVAIRTDIDQLRQYIEKSRAEDSAAISRSFAELWDDGKNHRAENQRIASDQFLQMNVMRDRMQNHEVNLASKYHTKEEIGDMLTDKLSPLLDELRSLRSTLASRKTSTRAR